MFLNYLGFVVSPKSSFYYSKNMICEDVVFQKLIRINGKYVQERGPKQIRKMHPKPHPKRSQMGVGNYTNPQNTRKRHPEINAKNQMQKSSVQK